MTGAIDRSPFLVQLEYSESLIYRRKDEQTLYAYMSSYRSRISNHCMASMHRTFVFLLM